MNNLISKQIYILKFYAICCVALAHSYFTEIDVNSLIFVLDKISRLGVFIFFILSGYFFHPKKGFWKKKIITVLIPWIVCAFIMYGYQCFKHSQIFTIKGLLNYFVGNGTFLYFLTILMLCYMLCYFYKKYFWIVPFFILFTISSVFLTALNILPHEVFSQQWFFSYLNPYLNIFNWIGFFCLGIVLQEKEKLVQLFEFARNHWISLFAVYAAMLFVAYKYEYGFVYWTSFAIPNILLGVPVFIALSQIPLYKLRYLELTFVKMGTITLPIYMYHETIINKILVIPSFLKTNIIAALIRPCLCVLIIGGLLLLGSYILKKFNSKLNHIYCVIFGLK